MKPWLLLTGIALCFATLTSCKEQSSSSSAAAAGESGPGENIDADEQAMAARLQPSKDPVQEEIHTYRQEVRRAFDSRSFEDLEKRASELRQAKPVFRNGSWKIAQFYEGLGCRENEPESAWELHDRIHQEWIAAKPISITARVASADFLTSYAWRARGAAYADKVTEKGWELFGERLDSAAETLKVARGFPEQDPVWYLVALTVALGQGWPAEQYDQVVADATEFEPAFWGYDTARAYSLLPRWYGEPGDIEEYAEKAAAREDGLGAEVYARIVIRLRGFYDNIFRETKLSWPKTREGLAQMREKYPESLEILSNSALLATMAEDRPLAQEMFARLEGRYLPSVWRKPTRFVHFRTWAETGRW